MGVQYFRYLEANGVLQKLMKNNGHDIYYIHGEGLIKRYNSVFHWKRYFHLGRRKIVEILEANSRPLLVINYYGAEYPYTCKFEVKVGLKKGGDFQDKKEFFEKIVSTNELPRVGVLNRKLGISKEEERILVDMFYEECDLGMEIFTRKAIEHLDDIHRPYV